MAADGLLKDWSELGEDLVRMIGQRLITVEDVIRSRAVCNSWSRALLAEQQRRFLPSMQWLMLPYCSSNNMNMDCKGWERCRCFYDVALHQFHHLEFPEGLHKKNCRGSAMGWLFMVGETPGISLFNPLTKTEIPLPPVTSFPDVLAYTPEKLRLEYLLQADGMTVSSSRKFIEKKYLRRVAMSAEPTSEDCIVMAIRWHTDDRLAFCRPAEIEAGWKFVPHPEYNPNNGVAFVDVVFWRDDDRFYALDNAGRVLVGNFSANPHHPTLSFFLDFDHGRYARADNRYLVICPAAVTGDDDDQLMMVARHSYFRDEDEDEIEHQEINAHPADIDAGDDDLHHINAHDSDLDDDDGGGGGDHLGNGGEAATKIYWTEKFEIFKMDQRIRRWDKVESIGDFALFLGFNSATAFVSTKVHPGLIPNSIYFTDDLINSFRKRPHAGHDMGIYNIATRTIKPLYSTASLHYNPLSISPLPIWFSPSPNR